MYIISFLGEVTFARSKIFDRLHARQEFTFAGAKRLGTSYYGLSYPVLVDVDKCALLNLFESIFVTLVYGDNEAEARDISRARLFEHLIISGAIIAILVLENYIQIARNSA